MIEPWGKFHKSVHHSLAHHCADVAACFELLAALPAFRDRLQRAGGRELDERDITRLSAIAFLHDAGKLHPGFQAKGWPEGIWVKDSHGHVQEGVAIIFDRHRAALASAMCSDAMDIWDPVGVLRYAAICHHGRPATTSAAANQRWEVVAANGYDPLVAAQSLGEAVRRWFGPAFAEGGEPLPYAPAFQHLFCGLMVLADWLGSNRAVFAFVPQLREDYFDAVARPRARQAVVGIGLDVAAWREVMANPADFGAISPGRQPRPAQALVSAWPLDDPLIVLEAETGSGKTEAALWRFAQLFAAGKVDGLYFAVPTRAAARQLHGRVNSALRHLFGDNSPEAVLAVPGYLKAGEATGQALPDFRVLWDDDVAGERALLRRWAAESAKRFLAATVAVGTVDQAMLASLQVKHAHLRAASLARSLLVIDEVHASDRYMREVQANLLESHLAWGGQAMLMSATLGASARTRWLGGRRAPVPEFAEAVAAPYPAVWGKDGTIRSADDGVSIQKTVRMELAPDWDSETAAALATEAARQGARVLVIRNTVTDAIATLEAVRAQGDDPLLWRVAGGLALHHSRFAAEDRMLLDREVEVTLSPDPAVRPQGGVIVIGTQTLEQSLDICADFLITDLCPADVLLQRIGRLHRHWLPRPVGFGQPRCVVLSPAGGLGELAAPRFAKGLGAWKAKAGLQGIYLNLHSCELTRRLITEECNWRIPEMNRWLVESATHDAPITALCEEKGEVWQTYWNRLLGKELAEGLAGKNVTLDTTKGMIGLNGEPAGFAGDEQAIRTRLGAEGERLALPEGMIGPFKQAITTLTLPSHWGQLTMTVGDPIAIFQTGDDCLLLTVGKVSLRYSRLGLERE